MTTSSLTVDQYIDNAPADRQEILQTVRQTILTALPQATEKSSYQMPTYHYHENIVHFAYAKHHLGFYPAPEAIQHFAKELAGYKTSKGAVQFPFDQPIPYQLIQDITAWRLSKILSKHAKI